MKIFIPLHDTDFDPSSAEPATVGLIDLATRLLCPKKLVVFAFLSKAAAGGGNNLSPTF